MLRVLAVLCLSSLASASVLYSAPVSKAVVLKGYGSTYLSPKLYSTGHYGHSYHSGLLGPSYSTSHLGHNSYDTSLLGHAAYDTSLLGLKSYSLPIKSYTTLPLKSYGAYTLPSKSLYHHSLSSLYSPYKYTVHYPGGLYHGPHGLGLYNPKLHDALEHAYYHG